MSRGVCRYFQNNTCRYGDRCWYSHSTGGQEPSYNAYSYVKKQDVPSNSSNTNVTTISTTEIQGIVEKIAEESKMVEMGNMWPLTCLSVLKEGTNVPGWEDFSMEELRAAAYASGATNCFQEYVAFFESVKNKAKENRLIFLRPGRKAEEIVRGMLTVNDAQTKSSSALDSFSFASAQLPNFKNGASSSPFGSTTNLKSGGSFFNSDPAPGLFAMAARGFNSTSSFQSFGPAMEPLSSDSAMEMVAESTNNPSSNISPFQQNIFGQVQQQPTIGFSPSSSSFALSTTQPPPQSLLHFSATQSSDPVNSVLANSIYTPMEDLSAEELEQFRATTFTLEKLPLRPPPQELC